MDTSERDKEIRKAFITGLLKGLSGATSLYSTRSVPAPAESNIDPIRESIKDPIEALRNDWSIIGQDIYLAITKHAQTTENKK